MWLDSWNPQLHFFNFSWHPSSDISLENSMTTISCNTSSKNLHTLYEHIGGISRQLSYDILLITPVTILYNYDDNYMTMLFILCIFFSLSYFVSPGRICLPYSRKMLSNNRKITELILNDVEKNQ